MDRAAVLLVTSLAAVLGCTTVSASNTPSAVGDAPQSHGKASGERKEPLGITAAHDGARTAGGERGKLVGITAAHNEARASVGVRAMTWSPTVAAYAQAWADQLAANGCALTHRSEDTYGENLFWQSNGATSSQVVAQWVSEKANYKHASNSCPARTCGHFTQVVWAASTEVGCGVARCGEAEVWVCNYAPAGNVVGQSPY